MILNPWAIVALLVLAIGLAGGGYYEGWEKRGEHEAAVALELKQQRDVALEVERVRADGLAAELEVEKRNIKTVTVEVIKQVPMVTTIYTERLGDEPLPIPPAIYTTGFVRLWNDALFAGGLRAGARKPADVSGGTDAVRAKIDSADILNNGIENFSRYADCRAQLTKLIDFERGRGKPPAIDQ